MLIDLVCDHISDKRTTIIFLLRPAFLLVHVILEEVILLASPRLAENGQEDHHKDEIDKFELVLKCFAGSHEIVLS